MNPSAVHKPARTRNGAAEASTLVLLYPSEAADSTLAAHLVAVLFAAAGPAEP